MTTTKPTPIQLQLYLNMLFADDGDYILQAQILSTMFPEGW